LTWVADKGVTHSHMTWQNFLRRDSWDVHGSGATSDLHKVMAMVAAVAGAA